jgi:hypothetical protein
MKTKPSLTSPIIMAPSLRSLKHDEPNAALEWQASRLRWRSRELMVVCPLKGIVRWQQLLDPYYEEPLLVF